MTNWTGEGKHAKLINAVKNKYLGDFPAGTEVIIKGHGRYDPEKKDKENIDIPVLVALSSAQERSFTTPMSNLQIEE